MNEPFRLFRREKVYNVQDNTTGLCQSLGTKDRAEANRLFYAMCEAQRLGSLNLQIARTYILAADPELLDRTWRNVIRVIIEQNDPGPTRWRWELVEKDKTLSELWKLRIVDTRPDQLLCILKSGTARTKVFLRRLHNFALEINWLPGPILPKNNWPKVICKKKRVIRRDDEEKILRRRNEFLSNLAETGGGL